MKKILLSVLTIVFLVNLGYSQYDIKLDSIVCPQGNYAIWDNNQFPAINVKNVGVDQIDEIDVYYCINEGDTIHRNLTALALATDQVRQVLFTAIDLPEGLNQVIAWVEIPETDEVDYENNELSAEFQVAGADIGICEIESPIPFYCGFDVLTPQVWIKNYDQVAIDSFKVMYRIDFFQPVLQNVIATVEAGDSVLVEFDPVSLNSGNHAIQYTCSQPNGTLDPVSSNNSMGLNFEFSNGKEYLIELMTDQYAGETSWTLTNSNDQVIASNGTLSGNTLSTTSLCLPPDCYTFSIFDSFGDGICAGFGDGYYTFTEVETTTVLGTGCDYGDGTTVDFCVDIPAGAPIANFSSSSVNSCSGEVTFYDISLCNPDATAWLWDFGDGTSSTEQNPTHVYNINSMYDISLDVTNANGTASINIPNFLEVARNEPPYIADTYFCQGENILFLAPEGNDNMYWYLNQDDETPDGISSNYTILNPENDTVIYYQYNNIATSQYVGLEDNSGVGGYFGFGIDRAVYFDAHTDLIIKSTKVYANDDGNRTFTLKNSGGVTLDTRVINILAGESVIDLDFQVYEGDNYALHINTSNNLAYSGDYGEPNIGYPFTIPGVISFTGNNYSGWESFWYFFYNVEVQEGFEGSCSSSIEPVYAYLSTPSVSIGNDSTVCNGNSIVVSSDAEFASYIWSNDSTTSDIVITEPNTYSLTVSDDYACTASTEMTFGNFDEILYTVSFEDASAEDESNAWVEVTTTQGDEPFVIVWSDESTDFELTNLYHGTYHYTITDNNGCSVNDSVVVGFEDNSSIENSISNQLEVYPNPVSGTLHISTSDERINSLKLYNISGQVLVSESVNSTNTTLEMSNFSNGVYFVEIICNDEIIRQKVVKK